ncbi:tyrosine--tRNA ligase [Patescibacteria group bacterium]
MRTNTNSKKIEEILTRGVKEIIDKDVLKKRLLSGKKLRIKYGVDPTKPDIHLGHTIPLRKLEEFQKLGHTIVFIIGDFTAQIGDPSGRPKARVPLNTKQASKNAKTYLEQVKKIIDLKGVEIQRNSKWYSKMNLKDIIRLIELFTIARILERDDFTKRIKANTDIRLHEILYPIFQAYDSVVVGSDVEVGGTDQKFNMLMGRTLQKRLNKPQQNLITLPLLVGLDGKDKMSKSLNNYIGITESSQEQYGKIMSIPDNIIFHYFELATKIPLKEIIQMKKDLKSGKTNPKELKTRLAQEIVSIYHSKREAIEVKREFKRVFKEKKLPRKIPQMQIKEKTLNILELLVKTKLAPSKAEAKRLISQKGVRIDKKVQDNWQKEIKIKKGMIVQVGKRRFKKLI